MSLFAKLKKAGKDTINSLYNHLDLNQNDKYMARVSNISKILESINYNGPITSKSIGKVINEFKQQLYEPIGGHYDLNDYLLSSFETTADDLNKRSDDRIAAPKINGMMNRALDVINSIDEQPLPNKRMELVNGFNKKLNSRTF